MVESVSTCFVRVWHDKTECSITGYPVLVVTYRLAFECFSGGDTDRFDLIHYNNYARERVLSVGMENHCLRLALGPERFLGNNSYSTKQLVWLDVRGPSKHNTTVVSLSMAYALRPQDPFRSLKDEWTGRSKELIQSVTFLNSDEDESRCYKHKNTALLILLQFEDTPSQHYKLL